jgi:hypothetical protein
MFVVRRQKLEPKSVTIEQTGTGHQNPELKSLLSIRFQNGGSPKNNEQSLSSF